VSTTRTTICLFCGAPAQVVSVTPLVQLDCPSCGSYGLTTGVISHLRTNAHAKAAVYAEIRRQLGAGVERPHINVEILQALKGR